METYLGEMSHIHQIRQAVMMTLSVYAHAHEDVTDAEMIGALSACFCDALVIKGAVRIKMTKSPSITSTIGVTLISLIGAAG